MAESEPKAARPIRGGGRAHVRIGISGWQYGPWRGVFYPKDLPRKRELAFASRTFSSIEINGTFYSLKRPENFARWAEETPDHFVFALKGPRYITHIRRLRDCREPLANFLASGPLCLGKKLGPLLWQLPPSFKFDEARLADFLVLLPDDTEKAAALARRHGERLKGRAFTRADSHRPLRHAVEIRNTSFVTPRFADLLWKHRVALVCADTVEWPRLMDVTADFVYCRLHGDEELYASGYGPRALDAWAKRIAGWARGRDAAPGDRAGTKRAPKRAGRDVFIYFDNDKKVRAPFDAKGLMARLAKRSGA